MSVLPSVRLLRPGIVQLAKPMSKFLKLVYSTASAVVWYNRDID